MFVWGSRRLLFRLRDAHETSWATVTRRICSNGVRPQCVQLQWMLIPVPICESDLGAVLFSLIPVRSTIGLGQGRSYQPTDVRSYYLHFRSLFLGLPSASPLEHLLENSL